MAVFRIRAAGVHGFAGQGNVKLIIIVIIILLVVYNEPLSSGSCNVMCKVIVNKRKKTNQKPEINKKILRFYMYSRKYCNSYR